MKMNVYIDGFNLYYGCLRGSRDKWLDVGALCGQLFPDDQIHRIRYFTARISSRLDDPKANLRQQSYLRALNTLPNLTIHFGHFLTKAVRMRSADPPPATVSVIKTEEKGSDVNLAAHLMLDAFQGDFEVAAVVSNDSDLRTPVSIVRKTLGLPVGIINPHRPERRSRVLQGDFFKQIRPSALAKCHLPPVILGPDGTRIFKPEDW